MRYWILVVILGSFLAQAAEPLNLSGYQINVLLQKSEAQIVVKKMNKVISRQVLKTDNKPYIKKVFGFKTKTKDYIFLDLNQGYTFGSMNEMNCAEASIWNLTKEGKLKLVQNERYRCDVNSSNEYFEQKEFYHPYTLNRQIPRIEYQKIL